MKNIRIIEYLKNRSINNLDLIFIPILVILAIIFILIPPFNQGFFRIIFALPLLLFLPGYMLIAAMFPKLWEISPIERFTLSIGLSIAITVFDGFGLNYTRWGFRPNSMTLSLSIIIGILFLFTFIQRWRYGDESYSFSLLDIKSFYNTLKNKEPETGSDHDTAIEKMLIKTMIIAILIVSAMLIYAKVTTEPEKFTAFYILGANGKAENYLTDVSVGSPSTILVGIENYEHTKVNYTLRVSLGGKTLREDQIILDHESKWLSNVTFIPELTSSIAFADANKSKLEFQLLKDNKSYRSVHLLINTRLDKVKFAQLPDLVNGDMESNEGWVFSGSSPEIKGSYMNETISSRVYEMNFTTKNPGSSGIISQNLTSRGNALAILSFDIRDFEFSNPSSIAFKQALLDGQVIWERRIGSNNSWEHIEVPVLLSGNNSLAFRVYNISKTGRTRTVWWDNIKLKPYRIELPQLGETIEKGGLAVKLYGLSNTDSLSSIKFSIENIGGIEKNLDLKPALVLIDDLGNQSEMAKIEWIGKENQTSLNPGVLRKGTIIFKPINNSAKSLRLILYINGEKFEFGFPAESKIIEEDVLPDKTNGNMGDTLTQEGFSIMLRGFQNNPGWTSQVIISVQNTKNEKQPFTLNPSPVMVDDMGKQYGMVNIQRSSKIKNTPIYPGVIRKGTIFFEPINPDAKYLKLIIYLNEQKYEYNFTDEPILLDEKLFDEKSLVNNIPFKTNVTMGETFIQDGFTFLLKGFQNNQNITSQVIMAFKNMEEVEKQFNINPSPVLIDDLGNQYEMVSIKKSDQIIQTIIYPGIVRRGSLFFEPVVPDAKFLKLFLYLNSKKYEFGFKAEPIIIDEKGLISNGSISIPVNATVGETITQGGLEINMKSFQNTPEWTSQVMISVKNIENEEKQFKYNSTPVLIDDLGNQYDMINIQRSTQIEQTTIAPLARIDGSIFFEPVRPEAKYIIFILRISSGKYIFGFEPVKK